jgi:NAD(P)-dependent dehydrogenase (short-subunit alcohol dehydrogenase family)
MPFELSGKTVLVTGASSGIGRQTCETVALLGAKVVATGRNADRLAETVKRLDGNDHQQIIGDLSTASGRNEVVAALPRIDGVVHCAGVSKFVPFKLITEEELRRIGIINYEAPVLLTQQLLKKRLVIDGGSILFISSIAGLTGTIGTAIYAGTKGALMSVVRVLALECASHKIRANCIAPGIVHTPMGGNIEDAMSSESFREYEKLFPLGYGTPQDVAHAVAFLLSDASRWVTGTTLVLDGGYTCR